MDKAIADKILEAEETIQDTVDKFVKTVSGEKIAEIMIPVKEDSWSSKVAYIPLSEYVGKRFGLFLTEKRYDRDGRTASYSGDRNLLSQREIQLRIWKMRKNCLHLVLSFNFQNKRRCKYE